jgi:CRP-like cAMP-binding protein
MKRTSAALPSNFRSTFLDGLTPREIKALLESARQEEISTHQVLQREGDSATRLWLLVTGLVVVYRLAQDGDKVFVGWGVPGDTFGLATVLRQPAHYIVTIEAVQKGLLYGWDLPSCSDLLLRCSSVSKAVNSVAAGYLETVIDVLSTRAFQDAQQRLARVVLESARRIGRAGREGIELDLTNEQLALAAHMSLFTATRKLSKWQELGVLKKYRGKIVLPSLTSLEILSKRD